MLKEYWICGEKFEIPIYPKEMVNHINETFTDEEKLKLINGMKEQKIKEAKKLLKTLETNGEHIAIMRSEFNAIKGELTLTERTAILKMMNSLIELPVKDYSKN